MCHFPKINFQLVNITNEMRVLYNTIYVIIIIIIMYVYSASIQLPAQERFYE